MTTMRKLLAVLATVSAVALPTLVAPTAHAETIPAPAACTVVVTQDNEGAVLIGEHKAKKPADATSPILTFISATDCPAVKTVKVTVTLPGKDLSGAFPNHDSQAKSTAKMVQIRVRPAAIKAAKAKAGVDYKVKTVVTFADKTTVTRNTTIYFMADTRIAATAKAETGGKVTISGTLSRWNWDSKKWVPLTTKAVHWYNGATLVSATTNSKGKFSAAMTGLTVGTPTTTRLMYGVVDGDKLYGASFASVTFTAK